MQIWVFFDPILAIMTSEIGLKFQNQWNLYQEVNVFASKFLLIVILIFLLPFGRDVQIKTFFDQIGVNDVATMKLGMGRHKDFVMYKSRSFLTQFCVNDFVTENKVLKNVKLAS